MNGNYLYDNYEISGCRRCNEDEKDDRQYVETCDDADAQFWTLYGHIDGRGVEAIGDFHSRKAAEDTYFRITGEPFTGSYQAGSRLRLIHSAPSLLAACQMVVARWEHGDLAEAARACRSAVELATEGGTPLHLLDTTPAGTEPYSVLLLYPDYANDSGSQSYYAFVTASDVDAAVAQAKRQAVAAQEGIDIEPDDFVPLLVTCGHHYGQPLFNK